MTHAFLSDAAPGAADAIERRYPPLGVFLPIDGGQLHALHRRDCGAHPDLAVVLLHGASGNARDMGLELFERLARGFRVLAIDRPGHGWSARPGGAADADPARQGELILQGLRQAGVERFILVAHSWAGGAALNLALRHPGRVRGVVLAAAATHPWPGGAIGWHNRLGAHARHGASFARIARLAAPLLMPAALKAVFHPQKPPPDFAERTAVPLLFRASQFQANAQDMAGLHGFLTAQAPRYGELATPVIAIVSDRDRIVPMAHGEALARQSEHTRLRVLHGYGHMVQHVAVGPIVDAVRELARRHDARALSTRGPRLRADAGA